MDTRLLHVLKAAPASIADADAALRAMRHALPRADDGRTLLLFCDLPPSLTAVSPEDDALIRRLQSGVMAAQARRSGSFLLLVRRRAWNDAARMYLGRDQEIPAEQVICDLLLDGKTDAGFQTASCSPGAIRKQYQAVLFSDLSLLCTPDTPIRMLAELERRNIPCIGASVLTRMEFPQTVLGRLARDGFSLSPLESAMRDIRARRGLADADAPRLYAAAHLRDCLPPKGCCPIADGCAFIRQDAPTLSALFAAQRRCVLHHADRFSLLPLLQIALLFFCGWQGLTWLALLAVLLPEAWSLVHPGRLPGALIRIALLPLTAVVSLDAWFCRMFARSSRFRIRLPAFLFTPNACAALGLLLITTAFSGVGALHVLLPIALMWLFSPVIAPALSMPTIERIPVSDDEQSQLRSLAEDAFFDCYPSAPPDTPLPQRMLIACAGAMLGLLEPDEAGRHIQSLLARQLASQTAVKDAAGQASLLVCAQYLREQMSRCDAALRPLPTQIERFMLMQPAPQGPDLLSALLRAAHDEITPLPAQTVPDAQPLIALFLPLRSAKEMRMHSVTLPLTHPHTFLRRQLSMQAQETFDPVGSFLSLAAASLSHPFYALMTRSAVAAPYMPLLSI